MDFIEAIRILSNLSPVIGLAFYLRICKATITQNHLIGVFLITSALADFITFYGFLPTPIVYNFQDLFQFVLIGWFYYNLVFSKKYQTFFITGVIIYASVLTYNCISDGISVAQNYAWAACSAVLATYGIAYTNTALHNDADRVLDKNLNSSLILNASLSFYFISILFLYLAIKYIFIDLNSEMGKAYWAFNNIVNILKNIGIAVGLYYTGKRKVDVTAEQLEEAKRVMSTMNYKL